MVNVGN